MVSRISRATDRVISALEARRKLQLFIVTLAALLVASCVATVVRNASAARQQWGDTVEVLVATTSLAEGDELSEVNVRLVSIPIAFVPQSAVRTLAAGTPVVRAVAANSVVNSLDIEAAATAAPLGWRIVAFPADLVTPMLHAGDHVDVAASGITIAHDAIVTVAPSADHGVEIAVPSEVAALVAGAAANGDATIVSAN